MFSRETFSYCSPRTGRDRGEQFRPIGAQEENIRSTATCSWKGEIRKDMSYSINSGSASHSNTSTRRADDNLPGGRLTKYSRGSGPRPRRTWASCSESSATRPATSPRRSRKRPVRDSANVDAVAKSRSRLTIYPTVLLEAGELHPSGLTKRRRSAAPASRLRPGSEEAFRRSDRPVADLRAYLPQLVRSRYCLANLSVPAGLVGRRCRCPR